LVSHSLGAAVEFQNHAGYLAAVLGGQAPAPAAPTVRTSLADAAGSGIIATLLALALALVSLRGGGGLQRVAAWLQPPQQVLHRLHSGYVGDYVIWLVLGTAAFAALLSGTIFLLPA
jgi:multicomponent Na+:H+ antiporter subunit D